VSTAGGGHPRRAGELRLSCTALDARPLFWEDAGDGGAAVRRGYEPELAAAVAAATGRRLVWDYRAWEDRLPAVLRGDVDGAWCGVAWTAERAGRFGLSVPYAVFDETLVVRADDPASGPGDLTGRRVAACAGSTNLDLVASWPGVHPVPFDGEASGDVFQDMIDAVLSGHVDGFVDDTPAMVPLAEREPRLRVAHTAPTGHRWCCATAPGASGLLRDLDDAIGRLAADGTLADLWRRHLPFLPVPDLARRAPSDVTKE
jgi:polar amino acid transport system substrate-binding protein